MCDKIDLAKAKTDEKIKILIKKQTAETSKKRKTEKP